jgi:hypothetical protein
MKNYLLFRILVPVFLLLFTASCQKEFTLTDGIEPTTLDSNQTGGGCNTYLPLTTGSTWSFEGNPAGPVTITITSPDSVINGKTYKRASTSNQQDLFWLVENGNFYQFGVVPNAGSVLLNPLRANAAINDTWADTTIITGMMQVSTYQMLEKNAQLKVNSYNFNDVVKVQRIVTMDMPPFFTNEKVLVQTVWFAKCIGMVQSSATAYNMGVETTSYTEKITSYSIK